MLKLDTDSNLMDEVDKYGPSASGQKGSRLTAADCDLKSFLAANEQEPEQSGKLKPEEQRETKGACHKALLFLPNELIYNLHRNAGRCGSNGHFQIVQSTVLASGHDSLSSSSYCVVQTGRLQYRFVQNVLYCLAVRVDQTAFVSQVDTFRERQPHNRRNHGRTSPLSSVRWRGVEYARASVQQGRNDWQRTGVSVAVRVQGAAGKIHQQLFLNPNLTRVRASCLSTRSGASNPSDAGVDFAVRNITLAFYRALQDAQLLQQPEAATDGPTEALLSAFPLSGCWCALSGVY